MPDTPAPTLLNSQYVEDEPFVFLHDHNDGEKVRHDISDLCSELRVIPAHETPTEKPTAEDVERLRMQVLRLGGVLDGFEHGVATRSSKPSDPDDVSWECLCGIGGAPERVERHWLAELRDVRFSHASREQEDPS